MDRSSETYLRRQAEQKLRSGYKSAAVRLNPTIHMGDHANVQMCETGAFVEVHVWVPKEEAEKEGEPVDPAIPNP